MKYNIWYDFLYLDDSILTELINLIDENMDGKAGFKYSEFGDQVMKLEAINIGCPPVNSYN
jgi:hypothetical protein